jgi:hypothetical protein
MVTKEDINKSYDEMMNHQLPAKDVGGGLSIKEYEQEYVEKFKDTILQYAIENYFDKYVHYNNGVMRVDDLSVTEISGISFYGVTLLENTIFYKFNIQRSIFALIDDSNEFYLKLSTKEEFDKKLNGIIEKANTKYITAKKNN